MNQINLVEEEKILDVTAKQLSVILGLVLGGYDIKDITNNESIKYITTTKIEDIIFLSTKSFFNTNINEFSNIITMELDEDDSLNSNIRNFLEDYKSLYSICPDEFKNSFLDKFNLNENDFESFKKSMLEEESKELSRTFLSRIAGNSDNISNPEELKQAFVEWISEWDTKKLLEKKSLSNFTKKYEVFFKYLDEVLLKCEKTEITSDIKNYVESNWMYNDFFSKDKKNNTETLSKLNELFEKYVNETITEDELTNSDKLFEIRLRETLLFIKAKTNETNDLATLNVSIESKNDFINEKPSNEAFLECNTHIMTSGYLDRCRIDAFDRNKIFIVDSKSFEILGNSDRKDIDKAILAALILSKNYQINYSLVSPSMYPSKENFDSTKNKISKDTENYEIESVQNLFLLSKIYSLKKIINITDLNFSFSKTDIGFSNGEYKKISDINVVDVITNSLTFFQKNNGYLNTDKNRSLLKDFGNLLQSIHYSADINDLETLKKVFSNENKKHVVNIVENNRWITDDNLENAIRFYFNLNVDEVINENDIRNNKYKNYTIIKQEQVDLMNIERRLKILDTNDYYTNINFNPIMEDICKFVDDMYTKTYKGKQNIKKEPLLAKHLLAKKFNDKGNRDFYHLEDCLSYCFNYASQYIGSITAKKWKGFDEALLHFYKMNYSSKSKYHSLNLLNVLKSAVFDYDQKEGVQKKYLDYETAQRNYIFENKDKMVGLILKIKSVLHNAALIENEIKEKNNLNKEVLLNELKNKQVHPENAKIKESILLKNNSITKNKNKI